MPALTNIAIADGAGTPVTHTYNPVTTDGKSALLKEKAGVPIGWPTLTVSQKQPVAQNGLYRTAIRLDLPTTYVDSVTQETKVGYVNYFKGEFVSSDKSTAQQRKDLRVLVSNLLNNASIVTVLEGPEPIW